jgi:ribokinase
MARPRVAIIGSSNTDFVLVCDRLPQPGETLLGGEFQRHAGGKGANQAVAAARAGAKVTFIGARGDDEIGKSAAAALRREGIDLRHFTVRPGVPSGVALILLGGRSRENIIAVARSANDTLSLDDIQAAAASIEGAQAVVAQLETPLAATVAAAQLAARASIPFVLNPAPARTLPRSLLRLVHTLTPNEHEATLLTGEREPEAAALRLVALGCRQVIVTLGARGALLCHENGCAHFRAPKVKAIDTVGAGDCFTGWLALGVAAGYAVEDSIRRALAAASLSVTRPGAQAGMPFREEIR